jgi:hypothetical protein
MGLALKSGPPISNLMWETPEITMGNWIKYGYLTMEPTTFPLGESFLLASYTSVVSWGMVGTVYVAGAGAGSMISAIPSGCGTVRDDLATLIYSFFGPSSPYNGPAPPSRPFELGFMR